MVNVITYSGINSKFDIKTSLVLGAVIGLASYNEYLKVSSHNEKLKESLNVGTILMGKWSNHQGNIKIGKNTYNWAEMNLHDYKIKLLSYCLFWLKDSYNCDVNIESYLKSKNLEKNLETESIDYNDDGYLLDEINVKDAKKVQISCKIPLTCNDDQLNSVKDYIIKEINNNHENKLKGYWIFSTLSFLTLMCFLNGLYVGPLSKLRNIG